MIKTPIHGSVQSLVTKCAKSANLPSMADFKVAWPQREHFKTSKAKQQLKYATLKYSLIYKEKSINYYHFLFDNIYHLCVFFY